MLHTTTMRAEERKDLLTIPVWSISDLMNYLNIKSRTTASKLKDIARVKFGGAVVYGTQYVQRDAILRMCGTNLKNEMETLNENLQERKV